MTSTASPILRLELMGSGDQPGSWGSTTNTNLGTLLEAAVAGYVAVPITVSVAPYNQVLTIVNYAPDESRRAILKFTGGSAATSIFAPPVSKTYVLWNATAYNITIYNSTVAGNTTAAGTGVTLAAGEKICVFSDGTSFYGTIPGDTVPASRGGTGLTSPGTSGNILTSDGTAWTSATPSIPIQTPTGALLMWPTSSAPSGWLLCDGTSYATATYASLFAIIGYVYGGSGANFNVPDFRDRMPIGAGTTYSNTSTGGSTTTTIALANLPAHDHSITDPGHVHSIQYYFGGASNPGQPSSGENNASMTANTASATTGITKTNTTQGNGSAFSNSAMTTISPYRGIYFIIKT